MIDSGTPGGSASYAALMTCRIADLDRWKAGWDAHESDRRDAGFQGHLMLRSWNEPHAVTVLLNVGNLERATRYAGSSELATQIARCGGQGLEPMRWLELLRSDLVWRRPVPAVVVTARVADGVAWLAADDAAAPSLRKAGVTGHAVARSLDDPLLTVTLDQADRVEALRAVLSGAPPAADVRFHTSGWGARYQPNPHQPQRTQSGGGTNMQVIATHDVDDVVHWFNSPKRAEFFEARGMRATAFQDPGGSSKSVAILIETPDMETLQAALAEPAAAEAEKHDGVHPDTIKIFVAG